jgi:hypothetical protein
MKREICEDREGPFATRQLNLNDAIEESPAAEEPQAEHRTLGFRIVARPTFARHGIRVIERSAGMRRFFF